MARVWLVRRFRREIGQPAAVLVVRRVLMDVRRADCASGASLHDYLGMRPLRDWLTGRVYQHLARHEYQTASSSAVLHEQQ